jgi:hypothetical protein
MQCFWKAVLTTALILIPLLGAAAQDFVPDDSLKAQLDQAGLKYEVTKSGNVRVSFSITGDRSQDVFIRGRAETLDGMDLRELWSNAGTLGADPEKDVLIGLLSGGGGETLGAWNLEESDDGWLAYYSAKLPADLTGPDLRSAVEYIAGVADAKEKELFDTDEN